MMRRLIAASVLVAASTALADPPGPTTASGSCSSGERAALVEAACELARGLGLAGSNAVVSIGAVTSDRPLRNGDEIGLRLARLVAGQLGPGSRAQKKAPSASEARVVAKDAKALVLVSLEISGGALRAVADTVPLGRGFWDRVRHPAPEPSGHSFASRPIDAEVQSFLPPVPLVATRTEHAQLPMADAVGLACGDVDRDGALELIIVGRRKILKGRLRGERFQVLAEAAWASLAPIAGAPLREPIGAAHLRDGGGLRVGVTDRESAVELAPDLSLRRKLEGGVPWAFVGCLGAGGTALAGVKPCTPGESAPVELGEVASIDAIAGQWTGAADGGTSPIVAYRTARDSSVVLRDARGRTAQIPGVGAALALGDVDRDGDPELVASLDTLEPSEDALVVRTWTRQGSVRERFRLSVPTGIRAIAVCPPEDSGPSPIAVVTDRDVRIVR